MFKEIQCIKMCLFISLQHMEGVIQDANGINKKLKVLSNSMSCAPCNKTPPLKSVLLKNFKPDYSHTKVSDMNTLVDSL